MSDTARDALRLQAEAEAKMADIRRKLVGEFIPALAEHIRSEMEREEAECSCGAGHGSLEGHTGWCDFIAPPIKEPTNG